MSLRTKSIIVTVAILVAAASGFVAANLLSNSTANQELAVDVDEASNVAKSTFIPEEIFYSPLTGEEVEYDEMIQRPVAIMINNISNALPQAGIGDADVFYEIPVEGGITRCMAIFQDYQDLDYVGSIRSSRLYFAQISQSYDAIYVHFGQSKYALDYLRSGDIDNISPIRFNLEKIAFVRKSDKRAPHNVYTDGAMLSKGIKIAGYSQTLSENSGSYFNFATKAKVKLSEGVADEIYVGYRYNDTTFEYDSDGETYQRFQFDKPHIDENTGAQLTFKNVIIQYMDSTMEPDNYTLDITTTGSGSGYYFTNGTYAPITWRCDGIGSKYEYEFLDGTAVEFNPGKTNICVVPDSQSNLTEINGDNEI